MKIPDPKISIVVPCFNEEEALPAYYKAMKPIMDAVPAQWDLILVDDGSSDHTLEVMRDLAEKDSRVSYYSFSRNFGKEAAMLAGLQHADGDYVGLMDADLQDPPEMLPQMLDILQKDDSVYDCVGTRRTDRRGEPPVRSFFARRFYKLINKISKAEIVDGARDFRLMSRRMVSAILSMAEYNRFSKGIFGWVGFKTCWLEYINRERVAGKTKWSFFKLFLYSIDGITAFSTAPLAVPSILGTVSGAVSVLYLLAFLIRSFVTGDPVPAARVILFAVLFLGGAILLSIGILGQYLSKTYLEVKNRPVYILKEEKKSGK